MHNFLEKKKISAIAWEKLFEDEKRYLLKCSSGVGTFVYL